MNDTKLCYSTRNINNIDIIIIIIIDLVVEATIIAMPGLHSCNTWTGFGSNFSKL